jgi:serine/threonine-protein kinase
MAVRIDPCDPRRLRLLAEDQLPADEVPGLEDHLEHCADCRAALDEMTDGEPWMGAVREYLGPDPTGPYESGPSSFPSIDDVLAALAPSDWPDSLGRLGSYEVKAVIGRGGTGVVFKAFDPALSRNVAIKVLSPHLANCGAARRRFLREAKAAAAVVHEHVVSVFAVVETAGLPFLVMEYVPGGSLQDRIDRHGPLALPEILRIGMQTAAGLAAAHAQGLVHRDVKPANILLENGIERVKLTDFGLARAMADASMTQSGLIAGTPHYMAPEQARAEATDHRADLFSLGSTLYAMCTGVPPFRADTPVAVVRRVADDQPRPIRELNPEIPAWLEAIVERLHAKDPAERFASASELADLLGQCLAHVQQPLTDVLPSGLIPAKKRPHRRRLEAAAFLAVPVALGLAFAYRVWWQPRDIMPEKPSDPPVAAARAGAGTMPIIPSLRRTPDETDDLYREAWDRAGRIEADLHRPADRPVADPVSAMVQDLADRAVRLERELAPGHGPAPALSAASAHPEPRTPNLEDPDRR